LMTVMDQNRHRIVFQTKQYLNTWEAMFEATKEVNSSWLLLTPLIYGYCWALWCMAVVDPFDLWLLLTPLIYGCCWPLWFMAAVDLFGSFKHCFSCIQILFCLKNNTVTILTSKPYIDN
jgi:hypothetical protein